VKQLIDNHKLKLVRDLNLLNRHLDAAQKHYYDIYK
jgi:hypothetical protein